MQRLVLVHTVAPLVAVFDRLAKEIVRRVQVFHVLDEPLLEKVRLHNLQSLNGEQAEPGFGNEVASHLLQHVNTALEIQANAMLVTCSTVSPYVDLISTSLPIVKIDETMLARAAAKSRRVGVLATNPTTLEPTRLALMRQAEQMGSRLDVQVKLVEGAFTALVAGDGATHDRLLIQAIREMVQNTDLIILAQASMARVVDALPPDLGKAPILTSPHTALVRVKQILEGIV